MCKGKCFCSTVSLERMIVVVVFFTALCRHSSVSYDRFCFLGEEQLDLVGWLRFLECHHFAVIDITDSGSVCATDFRSDREVVYQLFQNSIAHFFLVV